MLYIMEDSLQFTETSHYLVGEKFYGDVMFSKPVLQQQHVLSIGGIVLEHSNHLTLTKDRLQVSL